MPNEQVEEIKWSDLVNFFSRQVEALSATKKFKYVLYGGSVGSGKSYFLRWALIYWLCKYAAQYNLEGVRVGLFCEDFPALNDRHLSKVKAEFPDWLGSYNVQNHEFTLAPEYGSGVLAFRNLDDPSKYLSVEFAAIAIDEVNRNPKPTFDLLRTRLRWPGLSDTKFMAACNPIGEAWVKNFWVKRLFPPEELEPQEFYFVKALPSDNPHLPQSYFESLKSLPEAERRAFLEGDWDAFSDIIDSDGWKRLITDNEFSRLLVPQTKHDGYKVLGIDPAAGGDNSTIVLKSANYQEVLFDQKLSDTMDLVSVIVEIYHRDRPDKIVVDRTGVGRGVYDRLKQMSYPVIGIDFGEKPNEDQFQNKKAELYWQQREWLLKGGRLMANPGWHEFEIIKYKDIDGVVKIEPKDRLTKKGFKSPNCVDAAVLTQVVSDLSIKSARILKQHGGQFHDKTVEIWRGN